MLQALRQQITLDADDAQTVIQRTLDAPGAPNFTVRLWDGQEIRSTPQPEFTLVFKEPDTFWTCFSSGDPSQFAEAYVDGPHHRGRSAIRRDVVSRCTSGFGAFKSGARRRRPGCPSTS